jgi:hypothetical protein
VFVTDKHFNAILISTGTLGAYPDMDPTLVGCIKYKTEMKKASL